MIVGIHKLNGFDLFKMGRSILDSIVIITFINALET